MNLTITIFEGLPTDKGMTVAELETQFEYRYTRRQIMSAISHMQGRGLPMYSDGGYPARYTRDAAYTPPKKKKAEKRAPAELPKRLNLGIRDPLTPRYYDLTAHMRMNAR